MSEQDVFTLINHQNGQLAFKIFYFNDNSHFDHLQRNNFYSLIWVKEGSGLVRADCSDYLFSKNSIFAFSPYQPFLFSAEQDLGGIAIQFHSDFFCIHRNPKETNCDTVLFNNIYQPPFFSLTKAEGESLESVIGQLKRELKEDGGNEYELLIPILKIILVTLSRLKMQRKQEEPKFVTSETPFILQNLKKAIEENYSQKHSAGEYASLLNVSPPVLARLVKTHFNKTITALITERIIVEAKRELYLTNKTVKEIAWHLGYADEFYFSRLFKVNTGISPQLYRNTVGYGKAESIT